MARGSQCYSRQHKQRHRHFQRWVGIQRRPGGGGQPKGIAAAAINNQPQAGPQAQRHHCRHQRGRDGHPAEKDLPGRERRHQCCAPCRARQAELAAQAIQRWHSQRAKHGHHGARHQRLRPEQRHPRQQQVSQQRRNPVAKSFKGGDRQEVAEVIVGGVREVPGIDQADGFVAVHERRRVAQPHEPQRQRKQCKRHEQAIAAPRGPRADRGQRQACKRAQQRQPDCAGGPAAGPRRNRQHLHTEPAPVAGRLAQR